MKQQITVLHAQFTEFEDDNKKTISGVSLRYIDSLVPCGPDRTGRILGNPVGKEWLDPTRWDKLKEVPGLYTATFESRMDRNGHKIFKLVDLDFDGSLIVPKN